jgi:hypothetical protein
MPGIDTGPDAAAAEVRPDAVADAPTGIDSAGGTGGDSGATGGAGAGGNGDSGAGPGIDAPGAGGDSSSGGATGDAGGGGGIAAGGAGGAGGRFNDAAVANGGSAGGTGGATGDAGLGGPDAAPDLSPDAPIVDAPGTCSTDKDCSVQEPLCLGNQCAKCAGDNDCAGRPGTPACAASGLCVACTANTYCKGAAAVCDTATNQCTGCIKRSDCAGACQACTNGACTPVKGRDDSDPTACTGTCDSTGACKSKQGQTCQSISGGCLAGTNCSADGYCCDKTCDSPCMACDLPGFLGTCKPVASGNPHGNRASCGSDATCGGSCAGKADGTCSYPTKNCGAGPSCTAGSFVGQSVCLNGSCATPAAIACPSTGCKSDNTGCNDACPAGSTACGTSCCSAGQGCCNNACTQLNTASNCGSCSVTCGSNQTCGGASGCKNNDGQPCVTDANCINGVCTFFYFDLDQDGYPDHTAGGSFCKIPPNSNYIPSRTDSKWDCCDDISWVNPGNTGYNSFATTWPAGKCPAHQWDADCSGTVEFSPPTIPIRCDPNGAGSCTEVDANTSVSDCGQVIGTVCQISATGSCSLAVGMSTTHVGCR